MYFSPCDEVVELQLGRCLGSWPANPEPLLVSTYEKAAKTENVFLSTLIQLGLFLLAASAGIACGLLFGSTPAGIIVFLVAGYFVLLTIGKIKAIAHARAPLGVFEKGIRLGASVIRFDELEAISFGAPQTIQEKYLPTFGKVTELVGEFKYGKDRMQLAKDITEAKKQTTLTFFLRNEKVATWPAFALLFDLEHAKEFLRLINEVAPEKFPNPPE